VIRDAVLYLATPEDARTALVPLAGRPLAFRPLVAAIRAGCRVAIPPALRVPALERAVAASPRARAHTVWLTPDAPPPAGGVLLVPAACIVSPAGLGALLRGDPPRVLSASLGSAPPVAVVEAALAHALWRDVCGGRPIAAALARALADARPALEKADEPYRHVTRPADLEAAERALFDDVGTAIDTWLDRNVHRRLARPIIRLAVAAGIGPNQVSVASVAVGFAGAWCLWAATPGRALLGLILYAISVVLDHADGPVARLTLTESRLGEWFDVLNDTLVHATLVLAMGATTGGVGPALGAVAAAGVAGSSAIAKTAGPPATTGVGRFLDALGNRDGFYAMLLAFLALLTFRPTLLAALMLLVAIGTHAYWLTRLLVRLVGRH
jgi:phosphatidylglycerophosphate synthase